MAVPPLAENTASKLIGNPLSAGAYKVKIIIQFTGSDSTHLKTREPYGISWRFLPHTVRKFGFAHFKDIFPVENYLPALDLGLPYQDAEAHLYPRLISTRRAWTISSDTNIEKPTRTKIYVRNFLIIRINYKLTHTLCD
jgi:hypothetical protein